MSTYVKYPRTYHLPYSPTVSADDKRLDSDEHFKRMDAVYCSIKMDGENTTVYPDGYIHARSLDGSKYPWQTWLKSYVRTWCKNIPDGWRVCGENLYAKHSIEYTFPYPQYLFHVFGIYTVDNIALSYEDTRLYCELIGGLKMVDVFYVGKYDRDTILRKFAEYRDGYGNEVEGFVVRDCAPFRYGDFSQHVGKYVREGHVQTDVHWTEHWTKNEVIMGLQRG